MSNYMDIVANSAVYIQALLMVQNGLLCQILARLNNADTKEIAKDALEHYNEQLSLLIKNLGQPES